MNYLLLGLISMALGYGAFFCVFKILPKRLKADHQKQFDDIVGDAQRQAVARRKLEAERIEAEHQIMLEQMESDIAERKEDLKLEEEDLMGQERSLQLEESRIEKLEAENKSSEEKTEQAKTNYTSQAESIQQIRKRAYDTP
jgi:hypothetical protein